MKIIGKGGDYSSTWLAEITQEEIRKVMDYAYDNREFQLKVGLEIDLAQGYDFRSDIRTVSRQMIDASTGFRARHDAFLKFANMINAQPRPITIKDPTYYGKLANDIATYLVDKPKEGEGIALLMDAQRCLAEIVS